MSKAMDDWAKMPFGRVITEEEFRTRTHPAVTSIPESQAISRFQEGRCSSSISLVMASAQDTGFEVTVGTRMEPQKRKNI